MDFTAAASAAGQQDQLAQGQYPARQTRETEIYQCVSCHSPLMESSADVLRCSGCDARYPIQHNILDSLIQPLPSAIQELRGMAEESGASADDWKSVRIRAVESTPTFQDLLKISSNDPNQYYQQTALHFEQAVEIVANYPCRRVLEIGSETDYHFLKEFRRRGARCFAINLYFRYQEPDDYERWPEKTLADMNQLPFQNGVFDVVVFSATLHHSANIEQTMAEVARVLGPGGVALVLSEQIGGLFKREGRYRHRNTLINETYRPFRHYHTAFAKAGFKPKYLFSRYFDQKLTSGDINASRRFGRLGKAAATLWKISLFRTPASERLLITWHVLFGFPLNAILWKSSQKNAK